MSNDIRRWYQFALQQLAAESHLDRVSSEGRDLGVVLEEGNTDTRRTVDGRPNGFTRMPSAQSEKFIASHSIVAHHANDSTGFSGTLIRWTNDQGGTEYTLSLRSTEFKPFNKGGDRERDNLTGANGEIIHTGFAIGQLAALEDFYQREVLPIVGASKINVTGYSLGGHLATVFTETHADRVKAAYVFNGAGRGRIAGEGGTTAERMAAMIAQFRATLVSEPNPDLLEGLSTQALEKFLPLYQSAMRAHLADPGWNPYAPTDTSVYADPRYRWAQAVTGALGSFTTVPSLSKDGLGTAGGALITSIYGNALKNDSTLVANSQIHTSNKHAVYIEGQPLIEGVSSDEKFDFGNTHAITLIVDSLALMREFQRLDPSLSQSQIGLLIGASSARRAKVSAPLSDENAAERDALEKTLLALRRAFDPEATEVESDGKPQGFGDIGKRQSYFEDLGRLPREGTYRIEVLAGKSANQIASLAKRTDDTGLAVRYALRQLDPFAVVGGNYGNSRFADGEVDLHNASTGRGLTEKWIEARSRLLEVFLRYNVADGDLTIAQIGDYFQDQSRLLTLGSPQPGRARIIFGSDSNEQALIGFDRDDLIFGGANGEPITVNAGNDYVEGGGGIDIISGGPGTDELYGGAGDDQLDGGTEADKMYGGSDFDTYVYAAGDGQDQILDSDGGGQIRYKGRILTGGNRTGRFEFVDNEGVRYELVGGTTGPRTLVIDGKLTVKNFSSGNLGIVLQGEPSALERPEPEPVRTYIQLSELFGTFVPYPTDQPADGASYDAYLKHNFVNIYGSDVNDIFAYVDHPFGFPGFYGRGGDDEVTFAGGVGNVTVSGGAGADVIDASASTPLFGPLGPTLVGGSGDDFILGGAADETIWGDNYRIQNSFRFGPGTTGGPSGSYLIDDFIVNLRDAFPTVSEDAATLDILANAGAFYYEEGPFQSLSGSRLPQYIIVNDGADVLVQYLQLEGWLNLGNLQAAVDYVLGSDASFDDYIDGGAGNDRINAGSGADDVRGGPGNDFIDGDQNAPVALLGAFASRFGAPGDDVLDGGDGNDTLSDLLGGNDTFIGGAGDDSLNSEERVWSLDPAKSAFNYFDGGDGNDRITSTNPTRDGYDIADGGAGNDFFEIASAGGGTVIGGDGNDTFTAPVSGGILDIDGGAGDDTYFVLNGVIRDESGDDSLSLALPSAESVDDTFDAMARGLIPMSGDFSHQEVIRRGNDLVIHQVQTAQSSDSSLTIFDWFAGEAPPIEHVWFAGQAPPIGTVPPPPGAPPVGPLPPLGGDLSPARLDSWGSFTIGSGAGEDFAGGGHRDRILAGGGNDFISTGDGDDLIAGGAGDDVLDGGDGDDTYHYALGDGNDVIADESGEDRLVFTQGIGAGDVAISSIGASSLVLSVAGSKIELERSSSGEGLPIERLVFSDGLEVTLSGLLETMVAVNGAEGNDIIDGNSAANVISGGPGDDVLSGGAGDDTYFYNIGDGLDYISDLASAGAGNSIRFGPGISPDMLALGLGSLEIRIGDAGDAIHLLGVDPNDVLGAHDVDLFEFDDGTQYTYAELLARGFDLHGTQSDDLISGSSIADRIHGHGGDDFLIDGAGDDSYFFSRGDGADTVAEQGGAIGGSDRLVFAAGISAADISVRGSGDDIVLELNGDGGSVTVQQAGLHDVLETVQFADGSAWTAAMLREHVGADSNQAPPQSPPTPSADGLPETSPQQRGLAVGQRQVAESLPPVPDPAPAPAASNAPLLTRRENDTGDAFSSPAAVAAAQDRVGVPLDPLFREMQQRSDVLLQAGRANLAERYVEAIREFEERRQQRESPPPPPPTPEEVEAWNSAMHAWHDRNPGFAESDLGGGDGTWTMGWGLPGPGESALGGSATAGALPGLASPLTNSRLGGAASIPLLGDGIRDLR